MSPHELLIVSLSWGQDHRSRAGEPRSGSGALSALWGLSLFRNNTGGRPSEFQGAVWLFPSVSMTGRRQEHRLDEPPAQREPDIEHRPPRSVSGLCVWWTDGGRCIRPISVTAV